MLDAPPPPFQLLAQRQVHQRQRRLGDEVKLTPAATEFLVEHGYDQNYGARPLKRSIQRYIEDPLSEELIRGQLNGGDIQVYLDAGALAFIVRLLDEGLVARLRRQDALDEIEDQDRAAIEAAAFELAGILDSMPAARSEVAS